ncbi:CoA transferase [Acuticoccus sp. M5D2P5]|uniref:CaiB/BaiF CoA transferase family protein n=1 Tax=Acuticoccus kalidii TaxID=2910977 RepID=UPI001F1AF380|nr:CoA transferase [Acuticoccus kalidii]MCF3933092.1 CoA transferase [Acuticoccus kalidii]
MNEPKAPLHGITVVDLTRVLSGPFCTLMLADLGADVIKIETHKGDSTRVQGTLKDGFSWYYAAFNRNKRSIALDLYSEQGRAALTRMLETADVMVENFRPGVLDKMGFSAERLAQINPRLVSASVNGYGSTGPYVDRPSFDFIAQAMSGLMSVNGREGEEPLRNATPITDVLAGVYCALGIVAALRARDLNGVGQHVEAAMVNGAISTLAYLAAEYFVTDEIPKRTGNDHPIMSPYGLFTASDGSVAVAPSNDTILRRFLKIIDIEWVIDDPRYDTNHKRYHARREIDALVNERLVTETVDHWIDKLNKGGVPCGRALNVAEVFADPQVIAQEMAIEVEHPGRGMVKMLGFPIKFSQTPCVVRHPAPELGVDGRSVLAAHGYSEADIEALEALGVLKTPDAVA